MGKIIKNVGKIVDTTKNLTPFTSDRQPSPELKKKGWERRREAQKILDEFMTKADMSYKEIKDLLDDVKIHPERHTLREVKIANYLMSSKYTVDWLDRHVSKAPQQLDVDMGGNIIINIKEGIAKDDRPKS